MNRRTLMGRAGDAALAIPAGATLAAGAQPSALPNLAATYLAARDRLEAHVETGPVDPVYNRLTEEWYAAFDAVQAAPANTLADVVAKVRIAKREFCTNLDGSEDEPRSMAEGMARAALDDLLRLAGAA